MHCPNKQDNSCKLLNQLLDRTIDIPQAACNKCSASDKPQQLNRVIYGIAQFHETDPNRKRELIALITPEVRSGPGTELRKLLNSIGVHEPATCNCQAYANLMDTLGAEGCSNKKPDIIEYLNTQTITWLDMLKVALAGYLTTDALVTEAIKRSCKQK